MSAARDALMILAGVAIGAVGGVLVVRSSEPAERGATNVAAPSSATAGAATALAAPERLAALERSVEEEQRTRAAAEMRVKALEDELATARASSPQPSAPSAVAAGTAPSGSASAGEKSAAQVAARLKEIEASLDRTIQDKDGKKLLALYRELAAYGKAAWPLVAKIGAIFGALNGQEFETELGVGGMEFFKTFSQSDFSELYAQALAHPDDYDKNFRKVAIWGMSMGDAAAATPALLQALKTEKDPEDVVMIAAMLVQGAAKSQPGVADALLDAINTQKNKSTKQSLLWTLQQVPGDDATRALATLAAQETDPAQKAQLESTLKARSSPVAGFYVVAVSDGSDGAVAGLKAGDVITSVGGKAVKNWSQLQAGEDDGQPVPLVVYREGSTFTVNVKAGKSVWELGVQGDFAKGSSR